MLPAFVFDESRVAPGSNPGPIAGGREVRAAPGGPHRCSG
jgi:hypothetical protein